MGEFERIARLARRFGLPPSPAVGIGHDCALVPPIDAWTAWSIDASVEGVHFTRAMLTLDLAAERAVEAALSDLAAAGATPAWNGRGGCGVLSALTLPRDLSETDFDAIVEGIARATERAGAVVLGGNLASAPVLSLTTTVVGRIDGRRMLRDGARPGDRIFVTGVVGAAALGVHALKSSQTDSRFDPFIARWRSPRARLAEGVFIANHASAAIDISDGLAQDLGHVCAASGCGAVIDIDRLPMLPAQRDAAIAFGLDPVELALAGGEDYELCFTAPSMPAATGSFTPWTEIGEIVAGNGVFVRDATGTRAFTHRGWDHFT